MTRESTNEYRDGVLWIGFDYKNQAWVDNGKYLRCGHQGYCQCFGRIYEGLTPTQVAVSQLLLDFARA